MPTLASSCGRIAFCYSIHREVCRLEGLMDFIAHLKLLERNARTYDGVKIFGIERMHLLNGLLHDSRHCSSPASMNGCHKSLLCIIKKDRYAISCLNTNTKARPVCNDCIRRFRTACSVHPKDVIRVDLARQSKLLELQAKCLYPTVSACRESREPVGSLVNDEVTLLHPRRR